MPMQIYYTFGNPSYNTVYGYTVMPRTRTRIKRQLRGVMEIFNYATVMDETSTAILK